MKTKKYFAPLILAVGLGYGCSSVNLNRRSEAGYTPTQSRDGSYVNYSNISRSDLEKEIWKTLLDSESCITMDFDNIHTNDIKDRKITCFFSYNDIFSIRFDMICSVKLNKHPNEAFTFLDPIFDDHIWLDFIGGGFDSIALKDETAKTLYMQLQTYIEKNLSEKKFSEEEMKECGI